jgi:hypothetical protein
VFLQDFFNLHNRTETTISIMPIEQQVFIKREPYHEDVCLNDSNLRELSEIDMKPVVKLERLEELGSQNVKKLSRGEVKDSQVSSEVSMNTLTSIKTESDGAIDVVTNKNIPKQSPNQASAMVPVLATRPPVAFKKNTSKCLCQHGQRQT